MTIRLNFNMPEDFFGEILNLALDRCDWLEINQDIDETVLSGDGAYTVSASCRPHRREGWVFDKGDSRNEWQIVDHAKIEAAIQKIIDRNIPLNSLWYAVTECDACHIDADCADAILQIAMFDEIVFG